MKQRGILIAICEQQKRLNHDGHAHNILTIIAMVSWMCVQVVKILINHVIEDVLQLQ